MLWSVEEPSTSNGRQTPMNDLDLTRLLHPRGIAVIGASSDPRKISGRPVDYLKRFGFDGAVYPVNPRADEIQGLPSYASVTEIGAPVDVALIMTGAERVPQAVRDCGAAGVGFAVVAASGFAEVGDSGAALDAELTQAIHATGVRVLGPNCLGYLGFGNGVTATFTPYIETRDSLQSGPVGFVSQSGGVGTFMLDDARELGVGFSYYISTGNEADLSVTDLLSGLLYDEETTTLISYMEGVSDGRGFIDMGRRAHAADKPVVILKTGRSAAGELAAVSHTASLTGDDAVFTAIAAEAGITLASGQDELLDAARILSTGRRARGRRLTILSESGGGGVMMADAASGAGLDVETWDPAWQERMSAVIPSFGSALNPIDLTATLLTDQTILSGALDVAAEHPDTDMLAVLVGNADAFAEPLIAAITAFARASDLPIVVVWSGGDGSPRQRLREAGIPCFTDTGRAARALQVLADYSTRAPLPDPQRPDVDDEAAVAVLEQVAATGRGTLNELESSRVLQAYGIPITASTVATDAAQAVDIAQELASPVVLKILADEVLHKSDIGGVRVGVLGADAVSTAASDLLSLAEEVGSSRRILVQPMESGEAEFIVGARCDPSFGPIVVVGLGGIFVEILGDTRICGAPTDAATVRRQLSELKGAAVLDGVRGGPAVDVDALVDIVVRLSWLIHDCAGLITDVEINPLLVKARGEGAIAVDGVIVLGASGPEDIGPERRENAGVLGEKNHSMTA